MASPTRPPPIAVPKPPAIAAKLDFMPDGINVFLLKDRMKVVERCAPSASPVPTLQLHTSLPAPSDGRAHYGLPSTSPLRQAPGFRKGTPSKAVPRGPSSIPSLPKSPERPALTLPAATSKSTTSSPRSARRPKPPAMKRSLAPRPRTADTSTAEEGSSAVDGSRLRGRLLKLAETKKKEKSMRVRAGGADGPRSPALLPEEPKPAVLAFDIADAERQLKEVMGHLSDSASAVRAALRGKKDCSVPTVPPSLLAGASRRAMRSAAKSTAARAGEAMAAEAAARRKPSPPSRQTKSSDSSGKSYFRRGQPVISRAKQDERLRTFVSKRTKVLVKAMKEQDRKLAKLLAVRKSAQAAALADVRQSAEEEITRRRHEFITLRHRRQGNKLHLLSQRLQTTKQRIAQLRDKIAAEESTVDELELKLETLEYDDVDQLSELASKLEAESLLVKKQSSELTSRLGELDDKLASSRAKYESLGQQLAVMKQEAVDINASGPSELTKSGAVEKSDLLLLQSCRRLETALAKLDEQNKSTLAPVYCRTCLLPMTRVHVLWNCGHTLCSSCASVSRCSCLEERMPGFQHCPECDKCQPDRAVPNRPLQAASKLAEDAFRRQEECERMLQQLRYAMDGIRVPHML